MGTIDGLICAKNGTQQVVACFVTFGIRNAIVEDGKREEKIFRKIPSCTRAAIVAERYVDIEYHRHDIDKKKK